jgi:hypothetical protein
MRTHRLVWLAAIGLLTFALAQCGGGSSTPTSPSPSPTPSPTPTPAPSPAPSGGNSLSISPQTIQSQGQPQATITLASAAPVGGGIVLLSSNDTSAARVPASVTVPAGSRNITFLVDTSTVIAPTNVIITATYGSAAMSATLTVIPAGSGSGLGPSFVVRSRSRGMGACGVDVDNQELDCVFDASGSQGPIAAYLWTYTMGSLALRHTAPAGNAVSSPQGDDCSFYQQGTGGDGPNGERFLNMTVALQLQDGAGTRSAVVQQAVRVYPNKQCGFSY